MAEDFFKREFGAPRKRDNLFAWTVLILLLIGSALACWLGSFYIFGHPERPDSYKILKKLHKIEPPKRFEITAGPAGEFSGAQKLYERYVSYSRLQLQNENDELMRNYLNNYQGTKKLVPYVVGRFNILESYELKSSDLFPSGVVALAQAVDYPQVLIEHVYTAEQKNVPMLQKMLQTGLDVKLEKTLDLAAVIHIERLYNGNLQFTVVPLLYGSYALKQGSGAFHLDPPADLNLAAGAPIVGADRLQDALKTYADYRQKNAPEAKIMQIPAPATASPTPSSAELVRMDSAPAPDEAVEIAPKATPTPKGFKPPPVAIAVASAVPAKTQSIAMLSPRPTLPLPVQRATPAPPLLVETPPALSPQGVPLKPFIQSAPAPNLAQNSGGSWRVYPAGQMPRGRTVESTEASQLVDQDVTSERLYLRGEFVVTAAGENRAVLRSQGSAIGGSGKPTRVIVEFPTGAQPPSEGSKVARDDARAFQITDVRRGADGQVNVYAREVTR